MDDRTMLELAAKAAGMPEAEWSRQSAVRNLDNMWVHWETMK